MRGIDWLSHRLSVEEVRCWISRVTEGHPNVTGPLRVLQAKDWGVTAIFATESSARSEREVVFKACCVPIFRDAPRIAELLARTCPGYVPQVLAWRANKEQTWILFAPFHGTPIQTIGTAEAFVDLARTMAQVQVRVSEHPANLDSFRRLPVREIPQLLAGVVANAEDKYRRYWKDAGGPRAELMPGLPRVLERLPAFESILERWVAELESGAWPDSLDHPDLHANNAIRQSNGRILIFDWEEAIVTLPFFSLDELLTSGASQGEAAAASARTAYLSALPWGTVTDRQRALDLALRLHPIKKAHEYCQLDQAIGREEGNRHLALILTDMLRRWEAIEAKGPTS